MSYLRVVNLISSGSPSFRAPVFVKYSSFNMIYSLTIPLHFSLSSSARRATLIKSKLTKIPHFLNPQVALTSGEWEVISRKIWFDKKSQLLYFIGLEQTPLEKHLYVVSLHRPEHMKLLTKPGYSYLIDFDEVSSSKISVK